MTEWTQTINPSRAQDLRSLQTLVGLWGTRELGAIGCLVNTEMYRSQKDGIQERAWSLFVD